MAGRKTGLSSADAAFRHSLSFARIRYGPSRDSLPTGHAKQQDSFASAIVSFLL
jgi:hypothetical protein